MKSDQERVLRDFDRETLKADYASMFWSALETRKREDGFSMADLARACGKDKSQVSHWFAGDPPNWEEHTLADIARGLDIELVVQARDRKLPTRVFTAQGPTVEAVMIKGSDVDIVFIDDGAAPSPPTGSTVEYAVAT